MEEYVRQNLQTKVEFFINFKGNLPSTFYWWSGWVSCHWVCDSIVVRMHFSIQWRNVSPAHFTRKWSSDESKKKKLLLRFKQAWKLWPSLPKVVFLHKHITQNNHFVRNSLENISLNKAVIASKELHLLFFFYHLKVMWNTTSWQSYKLLFTGLHLRVTFCCVSQ